MKTPEEIAREIAGECHFGRLGCDPCVPEDARKCYRCGVAVRIAAAIVAERGAGEPHFCDIHRATSGASDCGLSPCEEATIHKDLGPPRRAKVRRVNPLPAPAPACARCGGSGWDRTLNYNGGGMVGEEFDPCPACGGKP